MSKLEKPNVGDPCPKCEGPLKVRPKMFFLADWGATDPQAAGRKFSGLVCGRCNSLWDNPEDSFMAAAVERARGRRENV